MTGINRDLPKRAWLRIYRVAGAITAISIALSVILTNVIMETFSAGINVQGLVVSILMPLCLGGPMMMFLMLRQEQLRHANQQLEYLATTDWLTECLNRGAFTRAAMRSLEQRPHNDGAATLLIIDADEFKRVNDLFGHDIGDEALRLIAQAIRGAVGPTDLVGRLGGEEFGVLLDDDGARGEAVAENVRRAVSSIPFAPNGIPYLLSVSIGGATSRLREQFSVLYRLADQHLYEAKNTGRDRVAVVHAA